MVNVLIIQLSSLWWWYLFSTWHDTHCII